MSTAASPPEGQDASSDRTDSYGWDAADRLTTSLVGGTESSYTYFADGLRASASVDDSTASFVWATQATVPSLLADDAHRYVYGAAGAPIAQIADDGVVSYLHGDMTGSIRTVTDRAGTVVAASDYSAYGVESPSGDVAVSQVTAFGYAGEYTDATGLIYLRARYYDPGTAQFLSIDALVDLTQLPHGYANGNPLQLVDPLGLWGWNPLNWTADNWGEVGKWAGRVGTAAAVGVLIVGTGGTAGLVLGAVATTATIVGNVAAGGETYRACAVGDRGSNCAQSVTNLVVGVATSALGTGITKEGLGLGGTMYTSAHVSITSRVAARGAAGVVEVAGYAYGECA